MSDHDWESKVPPRDLGGYEPSKAYCLTIRKLYEGTGDFKLLPALIISTDGAKEWRAELLKIAPEDVPLWRLMLDRLEQSR